MNTAGTGQVVARYSYDAWGKCTVTNASGFSVGRDNPFRYRGYYHDAETGFYYLNSRYYNPEWGRFISPDVFVSTGQDLTGANMFAYCGNNPVNSEDQGGLLPRNCIHVNDGGSRGGGVKLPKKTMRDVTEEVDNVLITYVTMGRYINLYSKANFIISLASFSSFYPIPNDFHLDYKYKQFYELVNHGATWDIKRKACWESTIGTKFPGTGTVILYHGMSFTPESLGNYTYRVLGNAFGIPLRYLVAGSFYAAGFPTGGPPLENELSDWAYVGLGYVNGFLS